MNQENTELLCKAYPELYGDHFAFACPDSWAPLLHNFSGNLLKHAQAAGLKLTVNDIKEKHNELRIYVDGTDAEADRIIEDAEQQSLQVPAQEHHQS